MRQVSEELTARLEETALGLQLDHRELPMLGARRRNIATFRSAFTELLEGCTADDEQYEQEEEDRVRRLLRRLAPSPTLATAWCARSAAPACCPAVRPDCSLARAMSAWSFPTTRRL
ncbi:hypothetical protein WKI71_45415 [Streptomyces sp. MS1.AVA.1]|uniref:Uncharacterized protein n=1 Tax=Streptomyces machairae TaxID=3134109 RepID=A0ABU8UVT1_9ACTN